MILQRLVEHYERLVVTPGERTDVPRQGFSRQKVSFCIVLERNGTLQAIESMLEERDGKFFARQMIVPGQNKPSGSGINPGFLWDRSDYMFGLRIEDPDPERTRRSFNAFRERHLRLEGIIDDSAFSSVCSFLRTWSPERAALYEGLSANILRNFGVFRISGEQRFVHDFVVPSQGQRERTECADHAVKFGVCLVTGAINPIARLHEPKIKGVTGAQTAGALLVSFSEQAYESYGKEQSYNAPVSDEAVFKYATALNVLLSRRDRRASLGDATVVFWADRPTQLEEFVVYLLDNPSTSTAAPERKERILEARRFLSQLRDGSAESEMASISDRDAKFFILGLCPNGARLSVRFWVQCDVAELKRCLRQYLRDIQLHDRGEDRLLPLRRILDATGRAKGDPNARFPEFDPKSISPLLAGEVARAVLTGGPYPQALLATVLRRIRSDGAVPYPRIAAIKGYLLRNSDIHGDPMDITVALDPSQPDAAYNLGRLFAALEKIEFESAGDLKSTLKNRYINYAGTRPASVFPLILKSARHHLAKVGHDRQGLRIKYDRLLGEISAKVNRFPRLLSLEEQGRFWIGYFHQHQDLNSSKKPQPEGAAR